VGKTNVTDDRRGVAWFRTAILCRPEWVIALSITLAAAWFHFAFLGQAGAFWRDEVNTLNVAGRHSLQEMSNDSFPVLMPLMVRAWLALGLGGSDQGLRSLGGLIGLGLLAALCARSCRKPVGAAPGSWPPPQF
jgi:hypothetical protein